MADTIRRMHGEAQFAGSSSVPAHVEIMEFPGIGSTLIVGATVQVVVVIEMAK